MIIIVIVIIIIVIIVIVIIIVIGWQGEEQLFVRKAWGSLHRGFGNSGFRVT